MVAVPIGSRRQGSAGRTRISGWLLGDAVTAVVIAVAGAVGTGFEGSPQRAEVPIDARGFALFVTAALVLALRRRWPLATLAVVAVCTAGYLDLGYAYGPIIATFMIAVYTVARHAPLAGAVPYAVGGLVLVLPHLIVRDSGLGVSGAIPVSAWAVVPFALGYALRLRHETAARARAEVIRQSVDDERFRVAQEVHDIVGHGLAAIKMQADITLHVLARKPEQAEVALEAISRTSSEALDELRAALAVVRRTGAGPERFPVPSLVRLDELRQRMAEAGVYVRLDVDGEAAAALPVAVELTGYRIIQESLTNVLRHSGARQATVGIRYARDSVSIVVTNPVAANPVVANPVVADPAVAAPPGAGASGTSAGGGAGDETAGNGSTGNGRSGGGGSGIAGMRERALALGGELTAARSARDTFEVRARLPLGAPS
ncbi:histidine kinase [Streptomyces sp. NBC_00669]|uniref:sensor histidine kinase n=1 Tax=Streptomyces sp. NBC_00669 TaxID=2976011 RepID=UPI002E31587F|nr:histidine kinase [Streptomyces sp. NBC_00669]